MRRTLKICLFYIQVEICLEMLATAERRWAANRRKRTPSGPDKLTPSRRRMANLFENARLGRRVQDVNATAKDPHTNKAIVRSRNDHGSEHGSDRSASHIRPQVATDGHHSRVGSDETDLNAYSRIDDPTDPTDPTDRTIDQFDVKESGTRLSLHRPRPPEAFKRP